jgi:hypothetical protein
MLLVASKTCVFDKLIILSPAFCFLILLSSCFFLFCFVCSRFDFVCSVDVLVGLIWLLLFSVVVGPLS